MDAIDFARICLDPTRLAALGRAAEGALTVDWLSAALGLTRRDALSTIASLRAAGLVNEDGSLDRQALHTIARMLPGRDEPSPNILEGEWSESEARVLRTFFAEDRLVEIPVNRASRRVILERLAQEFEPGVRYPEADVSRRLEDFHPDYAALRRYLVDESILSRAQGTYWRTGGRFPLDEPDEGTSMVELTSGAGMLLATQDPHVTLSSFDTVAPDAIAAVANDERIARFMTNAFPHPYTVEDAERWLGIATADDPPHHFAVMVEGSLAGGVGCEPKRDINTGSAEIGWWLNPEQWGHGIATAAVSRFIDYCFDDLDLHRVEAGVFLTNPASARVAEKAGMNLEGISKDSYVKAGVLVDRLNYGLARSPCDEPANDHDE